MKLLKPLVIVLLILLPVALFGAQGDGMQKAKTIDELAKKYDSSTCKDCHADVHAEWEKSLHARSIFGPAEVGRTAATIKTTIENGLKDWPSSGVNKPEDVGVRHLMICAKCHLPQLIEAEDSVAQEIVKNLYAFKEPDDQAARNLQKLNIGCLVCHQRNAIIHKWKFGTPDKGAVYGSKDGEHASPDFAKMKKSPYMKESILCGQCHGQGPNFDLEEPTQCATLYGSYNFAYRAEGGTETCQDCHMKKSKLGHNMQSYRAMGQMAIDMKVDAMAYQWRDVVTTTPAASVQVDLYNKAGHAIPDG
jgi:hypothetical protein